MKRTRMSLVARIAIALVVALVIVGAAFIAAGWSYNQEQRRSITPTATGDASLLDSLPVRSYDPSLPTYERSAFGQAWSDDVTVAGGHNGCDTRNDILARDLTGVSFKPGTHNCVVLTGHLTDAYTSTQLDFQRGQNTSDLVQIDHVVPLADAWYAGAYQWDVDKRRDLANDPRNLQATTKAANQDKKAKTADKWLPDSGYQCTYARRVVEVKSAYGLAVTSQEKAALGEVLSTCGE